MAKAARKAGRDASDVEIVAVTKHASVEDVRTLLRSGQIRHVGENRVQKALKTREALGTDAEKAQWRFIGHLQTNKARQAAEQFDWIDSIDSVRLAETLDKRLSALGKRMKVLLQVKVTERQAQSGLALEETEAALERIGGLENLEVRGLMAILPFLEPVEEVRPHCRTMRREFERLFPDPCADGEGPFLSMGMSRDFEIAVEEGANLVRIGTSIFSTDFSQTPSLSTNMEGPNDR